MLVTTVCPSCSAKLTISSYAEGKRVSCVECGHKFILEMAESPPVVVETMESLPGGTQDQPVIHVEAPPAELVERDWQGDAPLIRQQPPTESQDAEDFREPPGGEAAGWKFDEIDHSASDAAEWTAAGPGSPDRGRVKLAAIGALFGVASLVCFIAGLSAKGTGTALWLGGCVASAYLGVHLSLFGKGPVRIFGIILNLIVMLACVVWAIMRVKGS